MRKIKFILSILSLLLMASCPDITDPNSGSGDSSINGGGSPDLTVYTVLVSDSTPNAGQSITLSTTVRNSGGASSSLTTLRWYRSDNSTISSSDTQIGTDSVSSLSAGGSGSESITVTAPNTTGTYYYGACVDSVSGETSTSDNCSSGRLVTVISSGGGSPDLTVYTVLVSDSTPNAGQSITLSTTVRNSGGASSSLTTLRWYRSDNSIISSLDTQIGTDSVSSLSAGGSGSESITVTAPSSAGVYYYGACVDSVSGESSTSDNCSIGTSIAVIDDDHGNNRFDSTTVTSGSVTSGYLGDGDIDYFVITVYSSSGILRAYTTSSIDTVGRIENSLGSVISSDDDSGANANFDVSYNLSSSGTYYIRVTEYGTTTGNYNLTVLFTAPRIESGQLDDCETASYTLSDSRDSFKVTVDHSDGLIVSLNGSSLGRVTSEATFTRSLSTGDIVKLENDGTFCLGTAINYSITFN